jgi:hypothetical protein
VTLQKLSKKYIHDVLMIIELPANTRVAGMMHQDQDVLRLVDSTKKLKNALTAHTLVIVTFYPAVQTSK